MLRYFREHSKSFVIYLIFGAIIVVFALQFGAGSRGFGVVSVKTFAAKVKGRPISDGEFRYHLGEVMRPYSSIPEKTLKALGITDASLRRAAIGNLIDHELWVDRALSLGLTVSEDEVDLWILSNRMFWDPKTDRFDQRRFLDYVNYGRRMSEKEFRLWVREMLLVNRLQALVVSSVKVSDAAVRLDYLVSNRQVNLEFVRLSEEAMKASLAIDAAAIDGFLAARKGDVGARYAKDSVKYKVPRKVRARHILIKVPKDAPEDVRAGKRARAEELLRRAKGGEDFAALAREASEDGSAPRGGDLGFFDERAMVPEFSKAAFALAAGQVSEVVETPFGFHVIKVEAIQPEKVTPLASVERAIAEEILREERGSEKAKAAAERLYSAARAGEDLALAVAAWNEEEKAALLVAEEAPGAGPAGAKPGAGAKGAAATATPATSPASAPAADAAAAPKPVELKVDETGAFSPKGEYVRKIGNSRELLVDAFKLDAEHRVPPKHYRVGTNYFVVRLKCGPLGCESLTPDLERLKSDFEEIRSAYAATTREAVVNEFTRRMREEAEAAGDIVINPSILAPAAAGGGGEPVPPPIDLDF